MSEKLTDSTFPQDAIEGKKAAFDALINALEAYAKFCPDEHKPHTPPHIAPMLLHASPNQFHQGYNMMLDAGGYMPGKIPVVVVPARDEDLRRYAKKRTARTLMRTLGLSTQNHGQG